MGSLFITAASPCVDRHRLPPSPLMSPLIPDRFGFIAVAVLCLRHRCGSTSTYQSFVCSFCMDGHWTPLSSFFYLDSFHVYCSLVATTGDLSILALSIRI